MSTKEWYEVDGVEDINSPSLLVYPDRIEKNIQLMIRMAGGPEFLRPHIKTHKIAEIIELQLRYGITKFKCATLSEAKLLAESGAKDILIAIQPVGRNVSRFFDLIVEYPNVIVSSIVDNEQTVDELAQLAFQDGVTVHLWLDINMGMNRTGIVPDKGAVELYHLIATHPNLIAIGLHAYDGHIHDADITIREEKCNQAFNQVLVLIKEMENLGIKPPSIIAGGTPTFPIHAKRKNIELSPGTTLLWDYGYADAYKDMNFLPAAVLLGRIISKPKADLVCLNLGHKSVAAEMPFPRMQILNMENVYQIGHSEEHLVLQSTIGNNYRVGSICYAIPTHICPTVPKYNEVITVVDNKVTGSWKVAARDY